MPEDGRTVVVSSADGRPFRAWRLFAMRAGLVVASPVLALLVLEGALRMVGAGQDLSFFVPDAHPGYFRTNPAFTSPFTPASFALRPAPFRIAERKSPSELRVFVLGESAVMGVPAVEFGVVPQIRALLRTRHPAARIEIYNFGITAVNSHVLYSAMRDAVRFEPDLFVIYMGNNEVVGPYGPGAFYSNALNSLALIRLSILVKRTRTGQVLARVLTRAGGPPRAWDGMRMFADSTVAADDPRLAAVYEHFRANLGDMIDLARQAGAKVVLSTVVANFRDCAPFVSRHRDGLTPAELAAWRRAFDAGLRAWRLERPADARGLLLEALRIDSQYAETHFVLGRVAEALGQMEEARARYAEALRWDALRFRPDEPINQAIRAVARQAGGGITFVDAAMAMGADARSAAPIAGRGLLLEHVHFTWDGNYRLARLLSEGVETALLGAAEQRPPWLDSGQVASALAYTPLSRLRMLRANHEQTSIEPFTGQLIYPEERRVRLREIQEVTEQMTDPLKGGISHDELSRYATVVARAIESDPGNPALWRLRFEVNFTRLDFAACLRDLDEIAKHESQADDGVAILRAQVLSALRRTSEAEALLTAVAAREGHPPEALKWLARVHGSAGEFSRGRQLLLERMKDPILAQSLRMALGQLCFDAADYSGAASAARARLDDNPRDAAALNLLCAAYVALRQEGAMLAARERYAPVQSRNFSNNRFLADHHEARGDVERTLHFLAAAVDSGEGDSTLVLRLAKLLADGGRLEDMMIRLRLAREISLDEGNPAAAAEIGKLMDHYASRHPQLRPARS